MLEGLFSHNLPITICCTWFPGQVRKEMKGHECKMKGKCVQMKGRWEDMNAHWDENERNMKGKWMDMNTNERNMKENERKTKGKRKEMNAQRKEDACKWKENEGKCMQINATRKEHEVLPKHLKPTKQLLDPFPSLLRNGFWLHVGSRICWFPQNPGKR